MDDPTQVVPVAELLTLTAGKTELVTVTAKMAEVTVAGMAQTASEVNRTV